MDTQECPGCADGEMKQVGTFVHPKNGPMNEFRCTTCRRMINIARIEVQSDDPDRIAFGLVTDEDGDQHGISWRTADAGTCVAEFTDPDPDPVDPLDVEYDGVTLRNLLQIQERHKRNESFILVQGPWTPAQRAAVSAHWSAQLRAKVTAAKKAERNAVTYCELDADD